MTRGRKKDTTRPPSRAVTQQRQYRARRLQYVQDLEERVQKTEEENQRLRAELAAVQSERKSATQDALALASSDLTRDLLKAAASLDRFRQLVEPLDKDNLIASQAEQSPSTSNAQVHCGLFPSPSHTTMNSTSSEPRYSYALAPQPSSCSAFTTNQLGSSSISTNTYMNSVRDSRTSSSISVASKCCDGLMDCGDLVSHVDREVIDDLRLLRSGRSQQVALASGTDR